MVYLATGLTQHKSIRHLFGSWLSNQNTRNGIIFYKIKYNSILQVIFRGTYWLRFWAQLQRDEQAKNTLSLMSKNIEMIALELSNGGWKHFYHLF